MFWKKMRHNGLMTVLKSAIDLSVGTVAFHLIYLVTMSGFRSTFGLDLPATIPLSVSASIVLMVAVVGFVFTAYHRASMSIRRRLEVEYLAELYNDGASKTLVRLDCIDNTIGKVWSIWYKSQIGQD